MSEEIGAPGPSGRYPAAWRGHPPEETWVTPDDLIVVQVRNSLAAAKLQLNARIWHPDEGVAEFNLSIAPGSARALQTFTQQLYYGYLVSAAVTAQTPFPTRGQTLVSLQLARPPATAPVTKLFMGQDYLTSQNAVYWPGGRTIAGVEGPGFLRNIAVANPAAGADWAITVPAGARWLLRGGNATLAAANAGVPRQVAIVLDDGSFNIWGIEAANTQPINTTEIYEFVPGLTQSALISTVQPVFIPADVRMFAGYRFRVSTTGINVADQWSLIQIGVEESLED